MEPSASTGLASELLSPPPAPWRGQRHRLGSKRPPLFGRQRTEWLLWVSCPCLAGWLPGVPCASSETSPREGLLAGAGRAVRSAVVALWTGFHWSLKEYFTLKNPTAWKMLIREWCCGWGGSRACVFLLELVRTCVCLNMSDNM